MTGTIIKGSLSGYIHQVCSTVQSSKELTQIDVIPVNPQAQPRGP